MKLSLLSFIAFILPLASQAGEVAVPVIGNSYQEIHQTCSKPSQVYSELGQGHLGIRYITLKSHGKRRVYGVCIRESQGPGQILDTSKLTIRYSNNNWRYAVRACLSPMKTFTNKQPGTVVGLPYGSRDGELFIVVCQIN